MEIYQHITDFQLILPDNLAGLITDFQLILPDNLAGLICGHCAIRCQVDHRCALTALLASAARICCSACKSSRQFAQAIRFGRKWGAQFVRVQHGQCKLDKRLGPGEEHLGFDTYMCHCTDIGAGINVLTRFFFDFPLMNLL